MRSEQPGPKGSPLSGPRIYADLGCDAHLLPANRLAIVSNGDDPRVTFNRWHEALTMSYDHYSSQIEKTGFVLENRIAQLLKAKKWTVISNKYYVDDTEETVREIDLVAYKTTKVQHFDVYTTLIISCKKNEQNAWALLSRDINLKDPNSDWKPFHVWSNDKALTYQLQRPDAARRFHKNASAAGVGDALQTPEVEVFAFQEMNKTTGAPQNDKNIFAAITSLMKAQAYELGALPQRKKEPAVYQFNLLSIVDTDLIRLKFDTSKVTAHPVDSEHYIARYIIKKRESFSRIRFIRSDTFSKALADYTALHKANCQWFDNCCNEFYSDVLKEHKRICVLIGSFQAAAWMPIFLACNRHEIKPPERKSISVSWDTARSLAQITGAFDAEGVNTLNNDTRLKAGVAKALKLVYRYEGKFEFYDEDIPF